MKLWIKSLVGCLLIFSVVGQMLPDKKYEQYVRLFTGFLLILVVLQPVLKIREADSFLEQQIEQFMEEQGRLEAQIGEELESFRQKSEAVSEKEERIEIEKIQEVRVEVTGND